MNNHMNFKEYFPGLYNSISGIAVVYASIFVNKRIHDFINVFKLTGLLLILVGLFISVLAAFYIKNSIIAGVKPVTFKSVKKGPYKFIRHPIYLGFIIALFGVSVFMRSWLGAVILFALFIPSVVYRARLEEKALTNTF